jgi:HK97 family phage major capsid protein
MQLIPEPAPWSAHLPPIEIRDEGGADPDLTAATEAVEELRAAVERDRTATNERLTTELRAVTERLAGIETRLNRPGAITEPPANETPIEQRAFAAFVRRGREVLSADEIRALRVSDDTAGGYLAPEQFVAELIRNLVEISPIRQLARVMPTSSGAVMMPKRTGTLTASWTGETEDKPETQPAYGQVEIPVNESSCYVDVSNQLLEDAAIDIAAELALDFAEEFGRLEGLAFVSGNGVKKPEGFMVNAGVQSVANGHATELRADGLIDLMHALPEFYRSRGSWTMNGSTIGAVRKLKTTDGQYLWRESLAEGNPPTILGRPVVEANDMPDIGGGTFPIAFGDFMQAYRIVDRITLAVLRDPYSVATKGLVRFHARRRVGGQTVKAEAIRKLEMAV